MLQDGPVLFYMIDGVLYPVGLTKEQAQLLPALISMLGTINVIKDRPQGTAENLLKKGKGDN